MASKPFPVMTGDPRVDHALIGLARLIAEIAATSRPASQKSPQSSRRDSE